MPAYLLAFVLVLLSVFPLRAEEAPKSLAPIYPVNESDYLKKQEVQFDSADTNKNGQLDKDELAGAFKQGDGLNVMSDETLAACKQAGHDLRDKMKDGQKPGEPQNADREYRPMRRAQYLDIKRHLFEHMDVNQDHTVSQDEAKRADAQMRATCLAMPNMATQMEKYKKMHEARVNNKAGNDINALRKQQEEMMKQVEEMQKAMPKPQDLQMPDAAGQ